MITYLDDKLTCANPNREEDENYVRSGAFFWEAPKVPIERLTISNGKKLERRTNHQKRYGKKTVGRKS